MKSMTNKDYQTHDDAHIVKRHAEIAQSPARMNAAKAHIKKEIAVLNKAVAPAKRK